MLKGKTALVTGSTSGIGQGIAERFAGEGCNVVLNGFGDPGEIDALRRRLAEAGGGEVLYNGADMTRPEQIEAMMAEAEERLGGVDILVNNAGIQHVAPLEEFPPEKWDALIAILLTAAFHTTRLALPGMRRKGWGRIVNVASAHGLAASPYKAGYVSAKHGIVGLTKVVAVETAGSGITCNAICPGWVLTPLVSAQIDKRAEAEGVDWEEAKRGLLGEKQPSGEFVTPAQIAAFAAFLCSDEAAQITGAPLSIDGGWMAQ